MKNIFIITTIIVSQDRVWMDGGWGMAHHLIIISRNNGYCCNSTVFFICFNYVLRSKIKISNQSTYEMLMYCN